MNIDFHTHIKISKSTSFSLTYCQTMFAKAQSSGLDALCLTEHFNTCQFFAIYNLLDKIYPYENEYYLVNGLKVFCGMEVDIRETGHLLLIGHKAAIIELRTRLIPYENTDFIPAGLLLDWTASYNLLAIGAHPLRQSTPLQQLPEKILEKLDAFDLNGRDLSHNGQHYQAHLRSFAAKYKKPMVAGSDTHHYLQYGCVVSRLHEDCRTVTQLKDMVVKQKYTNHISPKLEAKVQAAEAAKRAFLHPCPS
ncbi:hypothetical protein P22_1134 [Propionispora sp. 2/2-37]|uniref:PHP domain-containing protein n=1 Tax=Propionispora sp. 2/2-37 TaxID=1677858 RepID=UPI0006BB58B9|nr:PHP domain-containing protein [Propionispora sp. 2/2-37]CUH95065.1 hypothetical protein P22_1134 [Propionispora sp. 2/2-37]